MTDGETIPADTQGIQTPVDTTTDAAPTSLYDKTEAIVTRQEDANKKAEEILDRQEKLHANQRLAGTTGGNIESKTKEETAKEYSDRVTKNEVKE